MLFCSPRGEKWNSSKLLDCLCTYPHLLSLRTPTWSCLASPIQRFNAPSCLVGFWTDPFSIVYFALVHYYSWWLYGLYRLVPWNGITTKRPGLAWTSAIVGKIASNVSATRNHGSGSMVGGPVNKKLSEREKLFPKHQISVLSRFKIPTSSYLNKTSGYLTQSEQASFRRPPLYSTFSSSSGGLQRQSWKPGMTLKP